MDNLTHTPRMIWVTPSLAICADWPDEDLLDADEATAWIQSRKAPLWATVRDEATAIQVMDNFGLSQEEIEDRLYFAKTGRVLQR